MKKKLWTQVAKLAALTFAAVIVVSGSETMTVHAGINWDDYEINPDDYADWNNGGGAGDKTEEEIMKEQEEAIKKAEEQKKALEALLSEKYSDVNTFNATVKIKANILKAKKKAGSYVKQQPKPSKIVVNGKSLKYNKKTKEYALSYSLWNEDSQQWNDVDSLTTPGLYRLEIMGKGNYKGVYTKRIYVYDTAEGSKSMSSVKVKVNKVQYSGEAITSGVIVSAKLGKRELIQDTDYTVTYLNNVNSGTGIVRLTATKDSGLVGEKEVNFTITGGTKISKAKVTGLTAKTYNYGRAVKQDMTQVKLTVNGNELKLDEDYAVQYYMNNTKIGTAKIVIAGKGKYYGTITKSFKITKIPVTEEMVDETSKNKIKGYTGKAVTTDVVLKNNGKELVKGTDYTLSYKNNIKPSDKAVIIVKGKGNYSGTINVYFTIQDKSKSADTQKAAGIDSETNPEIDEDVTDAPEEPVTDETADTEENPAEDETPAEEETDNTGDEEGTAPDDADNSTSDETGSDDAGDTESGETGNTDSEDADNTTSDDSGNTDSGDTGNTTSNDTDSTGSDDAGNTTSDDTDSTDSDDAGNTTSDDTANTGSGDAGNSTSGDTESTDSDDADNTTTDETNSASSDDASNVTSYDTDDAVSDNVNTSLETKSDVEPAIP